MSSARKCDRCRKYYEFHASKSIKSNQIIGIRIQTAACYFDDYDLCPKCVDKLLKFMNIKEDDKEKKKDPDLFPYNENGGLA